MAVLYDIVSDSSCDLPEEVIKQKGIHILPLTLMVEGDSHIYQSYNADKPTDIAAFYTLLREGKVLTTSLPNLAEAERVFRKILDAGRDVLYLGFSSGLSGTYEAIHTLLRELARHYPKRQVASVDTLAASGGEGLLVWYASQLKQEGKSLEEVRSWVESNKVHLAHWFTVDDLMFLFRGGRVSKSAAWAGSILNIKPILHVSDSGVLIPREKVQGRKKSLKTLVEHMEHSGLQPLADQTICISHGDCFADAEIMAQQIRERFGVRHIFITYVDPVIGAHSGPGTLALFFLAQNR